MAHFGVHIVITMIMASVMQKLSPQYSVSRWIICKRLIRYLHPLDEQLKSLAGISGKSFNGKNKREKWTYAVLCLSFFVKRGPTSQLMFKFFLAVWCGLVGAFFTFPGLRYARMHWDAFKYCEGQHFIRLLLHLSFVSPLFVVLLWVKPLAREYFTERSFPGMRGNLMSSQAFEASRIVLVLAVVVLRLCLMPRYLQSYLNLAPEKMAELRKEAGNISNIDLQRKVVRVFYYLCVVALQYITPLLTCAFTALLLKTLGDHSWIAYLWSPDSPNAPLHHNTVPGVPSRGPSPESILATSQQFSLTLAGLRAVFTPVLFRGVLSFMTWWLCATSFATSVVGLVYHSYTS